MEHSGIENFPQGQDNKEEESENITTPEENLEENPEDNEIKAESEPNIDHWETAKVMRKFGFTDINENPMIMNHPNLEEMRDQDFMYGSEVNDKGETITTIWRDGYCWARKGSSPNLAAIEEELGQTLRSGAFQPHNLEFEHTNIE
ncbi:MAG: hypothetical protein U5L75_00925 [Candidatus Campbellbacteria bacterium]|nr:hypothetical protein [Candidatus Campbellbacteria bacterium]